ncbi:MAG: hypothetical protein GC159_02570 [Phycisphaera sp.]|nr:hypothetical protein [Phycisphaera sp.]
MVSGNDETPFIRVAEFYLNPRHITHVKVFKDDHVEVYIHGETDSWRTIAWEDAAPLMQWLASHTAR